MSEPTDFINQYHHDTVNQRKVLRRQDGGNTTVNAVGIPVNGKIYLVPGYDRESGKLLSEDEAYNFWASQIPQLEKEGKISGIEDNWVGELKDHPANIIAQENHKFMDDQQIAEDSVGHIEPFKTNE